MLLDAASTLRDADQDKYRTDARKTDALVESLSEQVEYLKGVVATRDEEIRRRYHIIAGLVERVPALEAPASPEPRESPQTAASEPEGAESPARPTEGPMRPRSPAPVVGGEGCSGVRRRENAPRAAVSWRPRTKHMLQCAKNMLQCAKTSVEERAWAYALRKVLIL